VAFDTKPRRPLRRTKKMFVQEVFFVGLRVILAFLVVIS
jgi:hypothetical protein